MPTETSAQQTLDQLQLLTTPPHTAQPTHTRGGLLDRIKRDTRKGSRKADILGDMLSQPVCDGDDLHLVSSETNSVVGFGSVFWV